MTTRSEPLKVAIAGAGMISWHHLIAWRNAGERVRVVAVCDPDGAKAERRAQEFGIPRVYSEADALFAGEEFDALDVASPRETHAAWVDAAAARGIDVLCQKPLTPTFAESEALVRRTAGKIRLMAHENWRFRPWYRELRRSTTATWAMCGSGPCRCSARACCRMRLASGHPSSGSRSCSTSRASCWPRC
jgi:predicted dehydrogenase